MSTEDEDPKTETATDAVNYEAKMQRIASDHAKRQAAQMEKRIAAMLEERLTAFGESLKPATPPTAPAGADDKKPNEETVKLRSELDAMRKLLQERDERQAKADAEKRDADARSQLVTELGKLGVRPTMMEAAVAYLYESKNARVRYDKDGALVVPTKRDYGNEDVPLAAGLAEFAKSDIGKEFMRPVDAGGSGGAPVSGNGAPRLGSGVSDPALLAQALFGSGNQ